MAARTLEVCAVDDDSYRTVVDQLDLHRSAEDAGAHDYSHAAEGVSEGIDEGRGDVRRGGADEARAAALPDIGEQRELSDNECLASDVEERALEV